MTIENKTGFEDACVLGNIEMSNGKYEWEIFIDYMPYDRYITIGVVDKFEISKELVNDYTNSWSISSTKENWRMCQPLENLKENGVYCCSLDFDNDEFRIHGKGIDCRNETTLKGKKLLVLVNVYNLKNKITLRNFRKID